jgi:hypothetical protein
MMTGGHIVWDGFSSSLTQPESRGAGYVEISSGSAYKKVTRWSPSVPKIQKNSRQVRSGHVPIALHFTPLCRINLAAIFAFVDTLID